MDRFAKFNLANVSNFTVFHFLFPLFSEELTASSSLVSKLEGELSEALKQNEQSAANHTTVNKVSM